MTHARRLQQSAQPLTSPSEVSPGVRVQCARLAPLVQPRARAGRGGPWHRPAPPDDTTGTSRTANTAPSSRMPHQRTLLASHRRAAEPVRRRGPQQAAQGPIDGASRGQGRSPPTIAASYSPQASPARTRLAAYEGAETGSLPPRWSAFIVMAWPGSLPRWRRSARGRARRTRPAARLRGRSAPRPSLASTRCRTARPAPAPCAVWIGTARRTGRR